MVLTVAVPWFILKGLSMHLKLSRNALMEYILETRSLKKSYGYLSHQT